MTLIEKALKELKLREATRELIRRGGHEGIKLYILTISDRVYGREFEFYWYHEILVRVLWNIIIGKEKRVIVELAPRTGKTEVSVRMFISFMQGYFKFIKNMYFTYGSELTEDTAVDIKTIMESEEYKLIFPKVEFSLLLNKKANWKLKGGSEFFGTSVGGASTGKGSKVSVMDDCLKAHLADSQAEKDNTWKYIASSIVTRLEEDGCILCIAQRLSEDDPTGRFIKEQGLKEDGGLWSVFSFPFTCEEDTIYEYEDFRYERKKGEILPNRNYRTQESIDILIKSIGKKEFKKQFNQDVENSETGHFKKEDVTYVTNIDLPEQNEFISVDSAESLKEKADDRAIACVGWSINSDEIEEQVLMDGKRGIWDVYEMCAVIISFMMKFPNAPVYIEGAGGGITLGVVLKKEIAKVNAILRNKGKSPLTNSIIVYPPNNKISKQNKIKYMSAPYENHTFKVHRDCDTDFKNQFWKELFKFDPSKTSQTDNCIDVVASTWLFAIPKRESKKQKHKIKRKSKTWRGI